VFCYRTDGQTTKCEQSAVIQLASAWREGGGPSAASPFHFRSYVTQQYSYRFVYTECPTSYRPRHFFDKFTTNEDIAVKFEVDLPHCVRNVTTS
jgi:hypothetical protein